MKKRVGIWGEKVLSGVLVLLLGIFLAVLFCGSAEKFILQLFGLGESQKYEALKFLGIGMGGLLLALQALMSYRRATAMEDAANAQAKATEHQAQANENTEQGQRQERLKNAIEHLGHESDSVRLGGAYELFHLAQDILELRQTVLDILCAHIRRTTGEPEYREKHQSNPSEEIQSLLNLLFVQKHKVFTGCDINLRGSWLNGSDLNCARLEGAILAGAQLHGAHLIEARLHGAMLFDAQLHGAHLRDAQLHGAILVQAQLHGAYLIGAQLYGARLADAQLHWAFLKGAQLRGATSDPKEGMWSFETAINERIDEESDLSIVAFAGGLTQEDVASIGTGLPEEEANGLRRRLKARISNMGIQEFLKNRNAIQGKYTKEEAAQWIAEYKTAMSAVSGSG